ncbi:similar to Saccharomyces cerevisiae YIL065C FIS1 Protein involved in mitochondrial membrane fission and peroxisome abundance [Maudiozyma saulgeensis]|uniref:Mitochondrial fission 1 protein n=1 Tax=Maudiozyma saulgeensis TaxID=1789683 RepID=A0A1X7QY03_9SACH|nr:similar to Saccharomyces cerevisiae YIL065C FIS1 Protein involved in mitochondrial membrane fission and peroxisome abundance [Kazachstania saulgeensis]
MSSDSFLPSLTDVMDPLYPQQLEVLRQQVLAEGGESATTQALFNYAWGLIRSQQVDDQRLGVKILSDIYKETPSRRRECLYYLTIGCYKLNEYQMAKRYVDVLSSHEPNNKQVQTLKKMVEDKIERETMKGLLVGAGVIAGIATVAGIFFRSKKK